MTIHHHLVPDRSAPDSVERNRDELYRVLKEHGINILIPDCLTRSFFVDAVKMRLKLYQDYRRAKASLSSGEPLGVQGQHLLSEYADNLRNAIAYYDDRLESWNMTGYKDANESELRFMRALCEALEKML